MTMFLEIKRLTLCATILGLSSCATHPVQGIPTNTANVAPLSQSQQIASDSDVSVASTDVAQISVVGSDYTASQISSDVDTPQLTVEQLKAYADRCAPGQYAASASNIDCSELSLRVRSVFKTEDKVADALITLGRLGRIDTAKDVDDELGRNRGELSYSAQAVASGALDQPAPAIAEDPAISPELESFLNEIGLGINSGAIVRPGG